MNDLKFVSDTAEYLFNLEPDKEIGMPEDIGWHGLYMGDLVDGEGFSHLPSEAQEALRNAAAVILYEDESGFVDVAIFDDVHEAESIWEEVEDDYYEHFDSKEEKVASCGNCEDCECDKTAEVIEKEAYSSSAKNDIVKMFGKKQGFPQDEEGVDALLKGLQALLPPSAPEGSGRQKVFLVYLAKQLFGGPAPTFVQPEDNEDVQDTLAAFEEAQTMLPPDKKDINKFKTVQDIKMYLDEMAGEKEQGLTTISSLPETYSCKRGITEPGHPKEEIAAGSHVIASENGWDLYEIKKNQAKSPERVAAGWLTCNELWDVSWCTGRDRSQNDVNYQAQGDFWVLAKSGRSKYAISSDQSGAIIYNPADKHVWTTRQANTSIPKNMSEMAASMNVSLGNISSIPPDAIAILSAGVKVSPTLAEVIPATSLSMDSSGIDQVIKKIDIDKLIEDINAGAGSNVATALIGRAIANKRSFSGKWDLFNEDGMIAFINAWAATGAQSLPPDLEQAFIDDAPNFKF